jgi:hypothetical protein
VLLVVEADAEDLVGIRHRRPERERVQRPGRRVGPAGAPLELDQVRAAREDLPHAVPARVDDLPVDDDPRAPARLGVALLCGVAHEAHRHCAV